MVARAAESPAAASADAAQPDQQLVLLARAARDEVSPKAYVHLADFAKQHASDELGARAALALGYYDFAKGHRKQAQGWLEKAQNETLLREYVLYWRAQVNRGLGRDAEALAQLDTLRREFPDSALTESAVQALAETALVMGKPERALAALDDYEKSGFRLPLLLLRAQAREKVAQKKHEESAAAARDYVALYYRYPLSDEAKFAGKRIPSLERALRAEFPSVSAEQKMGRAQAFFDVRKWREARAEYERLLPRLTGADRERAQLRIVQCRVQHKGSPSLLASLALTDPEVDAERLYALSQARRSLKKEAEMLVAIEQLATLYPQSRWNEEGIFSAGNYFWVNLDRQRAASYYKRMLEQFPSGKNAQAAAWHLAWVAYLERRPEAATLIEEHLRHYPGSPYTANALYWLGRAAERNGNAAHARSFYLKLQERYAQTYFGRQAAERLRPEPAGIGTSPVNNAEFLSWISSPSALRPVDEPIPPVVTERWARAQALRTIAFDASAEQEFRAAYATAGTPRLLWEAARSALDAGHVAVALATVRLAYPQMEARKIAEVPLVVWQTLFPLPYEFSLKRAAERNHVDPMLVAGLIRQESVFQPDAVSYAGAVGLMQVLPKTGKLLARRLKVRYTRAKLFDPEYNLQLGTLYLADLAKLLGSPEAVLAAYNAGEDRVGAWKAERNYEEPAEFVESIPITQTREYVQICMRNAEVYRMLYGKSQ